MTQRRKRISIAMVWLMLSLSLLSFASVGPASEEVVGVDWEDSGGNELDLDVLEVGDIILTKGSVFDNLVPGNWTHATMYIGDGMIIESIEEGVVVRSAEKLHLSDEAGVYRVDVEDEVKEAAVEFALEQVGKPFNMFWVNKRVHGSSYYCSELVWASYKVNGICIDANPGWSWTYANGVAPAELAEHPDTYLVAHGE